MQASRSALVAFVVFLSFGMVFPVPDTRADELISQGLPPEQYSSSTTYREFWPHLAFDGGPNIEESSWIATSHDGWLEVDLGINRPLSRAVLTLHMLPEGVATYHLWVSNEPMQGDFSNALQVNTFEGEHFDGQVLEHEFSEPAAFRFLAVQTRESRAWASWYEVQVFARDLPVLTVDATCPQGGAIAVAWRGATPNGACALVFALDEGMYLVPARYPCQGTRLGLGANQIQLVGTFRSDQNGNRAITGYAGNGACGGFLQLLDLVTCATSNVEPVE